MGACITSYVSNIFSIFKRYANKNTVQFKQAMISLQGMAVNIFVELTNKIIIIRKKVGCLLFDIVKQ